MATAFIPGPDSGDSSRIGPRLRDVLLQREEREQGRPARP